MVLVLKTAGDDFLLYVNESEETPEGWHLFSKEDVAHLLMEDVEGVQALTDALANLGITFKPQHTPRCH